MKLTVGELRQIINEEALRGVPEFVLRSATKKYVDEIRQQITRHILSHKSPSPKDQRDAIGAMNNVLDELEDKVFDLLEDQLYSFIRQV